MSKISYYVYQGVTIPEEFLADVEQFSRGSPRPGARLESLKGNKGVFSMRLNGKARLLFTYLKGKVLILDILPNHEYHKSSILRHNHWQTSLQEKAIPCESEDFEFSDQEEEDLLNPVPQWVHLCDQKYVVLSDEQEKAVKIQWPGLVIGGAGTGKTLAALRFLAEKARVEEVPEKPTLFICESPRLAQTMAAQFYEEFGDFGRRCVHFRSIHDLVSEESGCEPSLGFEHFKQWLNTKYKRHKKQLSAEQITEEQLYQEFRIISGFEPVEKYLELGNKHSAIPKEEEGQRRMILEAYCAYMLELKETQAKSSQVNPHFYHSTRIDVYEHIVIDEAQDLSTVQIRNLYQMALGRVLAFMDSFQSLLDQRSKQHFFTLLAQSYGTQLEIAYLTYPYRCAPSIEQLASRIRELTCIATGGQPENRPQNIDTRRDASRETGSVSFYKTQDFKASETFSEIEFGEHANIAVITPRKHLKEAKALFDTPFIFTEEEIKGHQSDVVIVWKCLEPRFSRKLSTLLEDASHKYSLHHRPKGGYANPQNGTSLHRFLVACTRATTQLVVVDDEIKNAVGDYLTQDFSDPKPADARPHLINSAASSRDEWLTAIEKLLQENGPCGQVVDALEKLGMNPTEVQSFIIQHSVQGSNIGCEGSSSGPPALHNTVPKVDANRFFSDAKEPHGDIPKQEPKHHGKTGKTGKRGKRGKTRGGTNKEQNCVLNPGEKRPTSEQRLFSRAERRKQEREERKKSRSKNSCVVNAPCDHQLSRLADFERLARLVDEGVVEDASDLVRSVKGLDEISWQYIDRISKELLRSDGTFEVLDMLVRTKKYLELHTVLSFYLNPEENCFTPFNHNQWMLVITHERPALGGKTTIDCLLEWMSDESDQNLNKFGEHILLKFFCYVPELLKSISAGIWIRHFSSSVPKAKLTFLMRCLCMSQEGQKFLDERMAAFPEDFANFSMQRWEKITSSGVPEHDALIAPLQALVLSSDGLAFFQKLIDKYPKVLESIESSDWQGEFDLVAPLCAMSLDKTNGNQILYKLLCHYPDVIRHIPMNLWSSLTIKIKDTDTCVSPFYFLVYASNQEQNFIRIFIEEYPDILRSIPPDAWAEVEPQNLQSLLYFVTCFSLIKAGIDETDVNGKKTRSYILDLLEKFPEYVRLIPKRAWYQLNTHFQISVLAMITDRFPETLKHLVENYLALIREIPPEAWFDMMTTLDEAQIAPCHILVQRQHGILERLLEHVDIFKCAPVGFWTEACSILKNKSPLEYLLESASGIRILDRLRELHPELEEKISELQSARVSP